MRGSAPSLRGCACRFSPLVRCGLLGLHTSPSPFRVCCDTRFEAGACVARATHALRSVPPHPMTSSAFDRLRLRPIRQVPQCVLSGCQDFEIFRTVIGFHFVPMMNVFVRLQRPSEHRRGDCSMFSVSCALTCSRHYIPRRIHTAPTLPVRVPLLRAKQRGAPVRAERLQHAGRARLRAKRRRALRALRRRNRIVPRGPIARRRAVLRHLPIRLKRRAASVALKVTRSFLFHGASSF